MICKDKVFLPVGGWVLLLRKVVKQRILKNVESNIEQVLATTPLQDTNYTATCLPSRKLYKVDEPDRQDIAGEARTSS